MCMFHSCGRPLFRLWFHGIGILEPHMQPGISKSVVQALLTAESIPLLAKMSSAFTALFRWWGVEFSPSHSCLTGTAVAIRDAFLTVRVKHLPTLPPGHINLSPHPWQCCRDTNIQCCPYCVSFSGRTEAPGMSRSWMCKQITGESCESADWDSGCLTPSLVTWRLPIRGALSEVWVWD